MSEQNREIIITDIRMKFWSMVWFMVKWAIASIPALIILGSILIVIGTIIAAVFGGPFMHSRGI